MDYSSMGLRSYYTKLINKQSSRHWDKVTVSQYMDILKVDATITTRERFAAYMAILLGKPIEYYEGLEFGKFDKLAPKVAFIENSKPTANVNKVVWANGTRYNAKTNVREYKNAVYLSLMHYRNQGTKANFNHILAWIYDPTFAKPNQDKAAIDLMGVSINKVHGCFFLFLRKSQQLNLVLSASLQQDMEVMTSHLEAATKHFQSTGAGSIPYRA